MYPFALSRRSNGGMALVLPYSFIGGLSVWELGVPLYLKVSSRTAGSHNLVGSLEWAIASFISVLFQRSAT